MSEQNEGGQPGLKESGMCKHGNFPGNCQICNQASEAQPEPQVEASDNRMEGMEQRHAEFRQALEAVKEARGRYEQLQTQYDDVIERMDAALERRNQNQARMETNMGKPGGEHESILAERGEIAQLEADIQMEERNLRNELDRAMDEWTMAAQQMEDAYIRTLDPEASNVKEWVETFYQKRLRTNLDAGALQGAGYKFEQLPDGLTPGEIGDALRERVNAMQDVVLLDDGQIAFRKPINSARRDELASQGYEVIKAQGNPTSRRQQLDYSIRRGDDIHLTEDGYWVVKEAGEQQ